MPGYFLGSTMVQWSRHYCISKSCKISSRGVCSTIAPRRSSTTSTVRDLVSKATLDMASANAISMDSDMISTSYLFIVCLRVLPRARHYRVAMFCVKVDHSHFSKQNISILRERKRCSTWRQWNYWFICGLGSEPVLSRIRVQKLPPPEQGFICFV